ncbi:D-alanyl-D-alanine carboxypeptidase family protein [Devosia sp. RR2S18]|uniref:D-alanyl-D-alanine carboxypeptidase family protein n=1 Tax=Devosia rhizosphaerae TaxID=3049774 RepID=UPI00254137FB|nr:D-alanyl-D-alanine carboxypeptidase family protein [Devosia sp. RR2S18]WIJ25638.1 D-alanyl-D-alanine carboxypeptidase family protein [Devosia sp. RR2S18]
MLFAQRLVSALVCVLLVIAPVRANPTLLVDAQTLDVLYAEDAGQPWHPASLTKMMTAYVAFEAIAKGTVTLDTPVVLSRNAINQAPSKSGLPVGSALTLKDALYLLLVKSANDIAVGIAETIGGSEDAFVAEMNEVAQRIGLTATHFANPHGLHDPAQVTSARDLAILTLYIQQNYPQYLPIFGTDAVRLDDVRLESQNELLTKFAGTTGMKTGYVCASGLNMVATVQRNGRNLIAVVLGGSSSRERNERAAELLLKGLSGAASPTGQNVQMLANAPGAAPVDMRPKVCGAEAAAYKEAREAAFPMGLEGQPSYLNDVVEGSSYVATNLGRLAFGVSLPRPRPPHMPIYAPPEVEIALEGELRGGVAGGPVIPYPRPRPDNR